MTVYNCRDCGGTGTQPTHHPACHRLPVARLWADPAAARARDAMAAWRTANDAFAATSLAPSAAAEWATARDAEIAARNALIPALAGLLFQLDARAGIQRPAVTVSGAEPQSCGRCKSAPGTMPGYDPARGKFCRACADRCHESTDAFHICEVCAAPEERYP